MSNYSAYLQTQQAQMLQHIQALVRIESIKGPAQPGQPFGPGPARALDYVLQLGRELGFTACNLDNYLGWLDYAPGLAADVPTVAVLTHVDTVEIGDGWSVEPLGGAIVGDRLYGRGAYDDKGPAIATIYALCALQEAGFRPQKRIRLIFGCDEESGMSDIPYYLEHQPQPVLGFSPDAPFPVTYGEKGIAEFEMFCPLPPEARDLLQLSSGGSGKEVPPSATARLRLPESPTQQLQALVAAQAQTAEGCRYALTTTEVGVLSLLATGKRAAAARPQEGLNAISGLLLLLAELTDLPPALAEFLQAYRRLLGWQTDGSALGCAQSDTISSPLTVCVTEIASASAGLRLTLQIRYPVRGDYAALLRQLGQACLSAGWELGETRHLPAHYLPPDSALVATLMEIYRRESGQPDSQPQTMEGGTYARTMRNVVAYGPLFPGEPQTAHGADEYLNISSIFRATDIYSQALESLAR